MKKASALFLLILFLVTNSGVAFSIHWCGGKLASVDFFTGDKQLCKCGKRSMKPGCCKDKITHLKGCDELFKTNLLTLKIPAPKLELEIQPQIIIGLGRPSIFISDFYHPPPYKPKSPIYLLDGVFLI